MFNKWGQNAVTPIYTHIPQYAGIMRFFPTSAYNRMDPLLTIGDYYEKYLFSIGGNNFFGLWKF